MNLALDGAMNVYRGKTFFNEPYIFAMIPEKKKWPRTGGFGVKK